MSTPSLPDAVRRRLTPVLLVGLVLLASCSADQQDAAEAPPTPDLPAGAVLVVDGTTVSRDEFDDQLRQIAGNQGYLDARAAGRNGTPLVVFRQGTPGTQVPTDLASDFVVEFLNERVSFALAAEELAERGGSVSDADRADALTLLADAGLTESVLAGFGSYRDVLVEGEATVLALSHELSGVSPEQELQQLYDEVRSQLELVSCVDHIVMVAGTGDGTGTEEEYAAARAGLDAADARLTAGEDFATVATETSQDKVSAPDGGDLGCSPRGALLPELDALAWNAEPGTVSDPVRTSVGWHVVRVRERREPSFDEAAPTLIQLALQRERTAFLEWLAGAAEGASVAVDPAYGEWDRSVGSVVAPGRAGAATELELEPADEGTGG